MCVTYLNGFGIGFVEEIKQCTAKVMRMNVWITKLICNGIKEQIASFIVQVNSQVLQDIHVCIVNDVCDCWILILGTAKINK